MPSFRKKPVVVEAKRWDGSGEALDEIFDWFTSNDARVSTASENKLAILTLEGVMKADVGDWIIRGVKGEFYPCKHDVFEATYELHSSEGRVEGPSFDTLHQIAETSPFLRAAITDRVAEVSGFPFGERWEVYRCASAEPDQACGIRTVPADGSVPTDGSIPRVVVSDTNEGVCKHHMRLVDAEHVVWLHNHYVAPTIVVNVPDDFSAEKFEEFRKSWNEGRR